MLWHRNGRCSEHPGHLVGRHAGGGAAGRDRRAQGPRPPGHHLRRDRRGSQPRPVALLPAAFRLRAPPQRGQGAAARGGGSTGVRWRRRGRTDRDLRRGTGHRGVSRRHRPRRGARHRQRPGLAHGAPARPRRRARPPRALPRPPGIAGPRGVVRTPAPGRAAPGQRHVARRRLRAPLTARACGARHRARAAGPLGARTRRGREGDGRAHRPAAAR